MASNTQELQQKVCQRFGWSLVFTRLNDGKWQAEIVTGLGAHKKYVYVTEYSFQEDRHGKSAVSAVALRGLKDEIVTREALPIMELTQVFSDTVTHLPILDSKDPRSWQRFWRAPPKAVGIDTEGNGISPPVLVQIATLDYVILETPRKSLSPNLMRLLQDDSITKVFCDNFAHKDKLCLGFPVVLSHDDTEAYTKPPIVDLENLSMQLLGPVKAARGLGRIVALTMPELNVRIEKPKKATGGAKAKFSHVAKFAFIEQGRMNPLRGLGDLTTREQEYAALDAWCTLVVYERIQQLQKGQDGYA